MEKTTLKKLCQISAPQELDKIVIGSFLENNKLTVTKGFIYNFFTGDNFNVLDVCSDIHTIEDVIKIYEQAIPAKEKTQNGAFYTPQYIREYIIHNLYSQDRTKFSEGKFIDPACGCGAFLTSVAEVLVKDEAKSYAEALSQIFGVDISETSIRRAKILLGLAALKNGEELDGTEFNLYSGNSLSFDFFALNEVQDNGGFDFVVGNPPYVRAKNIDSESKSLLSRWSVTHEGNADLYIPFFQLGVSLLNKNGTLGYITANSFFKSVNARLLRKYFSSNQLTLKIIDFGDELIFENKLAYTCIVFISKTEMTHIHYAKSSSKAIRLKTEISFDTIPYFTLNNIKGWNLNSGDVLSVIRRIESIGQPLGKKYNIKNGIATLANDLFIFKPVKQDSNYYYLHSNGLLFPIEKKICKDIIKPNVLHCEKEIPDLEEKVIFPYDENYKIISEEEMQLKYPMAYAYLSDHREKLEARDNGTGNFPTWYAFGRTQAISDRGRKLLFPYMTAIPHFVYTDKEDMLIYCGYAIFHNDEKELLALKRILESSVFEYYMRHTSKPYATGYFSYAKNYVKNFGIYPLSDCQKQFLINQDDKEAIDSFVEKIYGIDLSKNQCYNLPSQTYTTPSLFAI